MNDTPPTGGPADPIADARTQVATYEAAWQDKPRDVTACTRLAWALLTLAECLEDTIEQAHGTRKRYLKWKAACAESNALCKRVLELTYVVSGQDPACLIALEYRRHAYLNLGQFAACLEVCERLTAADPSNTMARQHRAYCLYRMGNCAESARAHENAWDHEPENAGFLHSAAHCYRLAGDLEGARRVAELGAASFPDNLAFQKLLLDHALKDQRFEDALHRAEAIALVDPEDFSLRASAGHALLRLGQEDAATAAFHEAIRLAAAQSEIATNDPVNCGPGYLRVILWAEENGYRETEAALLAMMLADENPHLQGRAWMQARLREQLDGAADDGDECDRFRDAWALKLDFFLESLLASKAYGKKPGHNRREHVELLEFLVDMFQHEGHAPCVERCLEALQSIDPERAEILRGKIAAADSKPSQ